MALDYVSLGKRIKNIRKTKELSRDELAKRVGITSDYLSNIENNHSIPSLKTTMLLCQALCIMPDDLLIGIERVSEDYLIPDIIEKLKDCSSEEKQLVFEFLDSLERKRKKGD